MSNKYYEVYDDGTRNWYCANVSTSYIRDKTKAYKARNKWGYRDYATVVFAESAGKARAIA